MPANAPPITITKAPGRQYYPSLDGLRGLAILLVIVYHNFGFINYSSFGWLGVDLFFVLSGFLITNILLNTIGEKNFLKNFYMRRALRIFPLYYLCLVIFLLVLPPLGVFPGSEYYTENQGWLWAYLQNWLFIFKGDDQTITLHHLWSLAVEEQFYIVWPLLILLVRKPKALLVLISVALVAVIALRLWIWKYDVADLSYYRLYTFTRVDGLCIGCMVALLHKINADFLKRYTTVIVLGFALVNFGFFFVNRMYDFSFPYLALVGYTTFAMIFGLLVHEATRETKFMNSIFNFPLLRFFGKISYGLYIIHWPLYVLAGPYLENWIDSRMQPPNARLIVSVTATLAAVGLSWLSFRYYESYFLKLKTRFA